MEEGTRYERVKGMKIPKRCKGCSTTKHIMKSGGDDQCLASRVINCPCETCIVKPMCASKTKCVGFIYACCKTPPNDVKDILVHLESLDANIRDQVKAKLTPV